MKKNLKVLGIILCAGCGHNPNNATTVMSVPQVSTHNGKDLVKEEPVIEPDEGTEKNSILLPQQA